MLKWECSTHKSSKMIHEQIFTFYFFYFIRYQFKWYPFGSDARLPTTFQLFSYHFSSIFCLRMECKILFWCAQNDSAKLKRIFIIWMVLLTVGKILYTGLSITMYFMCDNEWMNERWDGWFYFFLRFCFFKLTNKLFNTFTA